MLTSEYINHEVFRRLKLFSGFYEDLSDNVMKFLPLETKGIINFDTYSYTSMQGTLESIHDILLKGRINDAYALLRKFYDSALINVYCQLYLQDNFSFENFVVEQISGWISGAVQLPKIHLIQNYISNSEKVSGVHALLKSDKRYKAIRDRGNDHAHYNFFKFALLNDNKVYLKNRIQVLDQFLKDLDDIFILHFAYIFYINDHYLSSSDYVDYLDICMEPPERCQYEVAPFISNFY
jgi:hypothetical protein